MDTARWAHRGFDWVTRLATVAAHLCPTLSSLAGAAVGVLIALTCTPGTGRRGDGTRPGTPWRHRAAPPGAGEPA